MPIIDADAHVIETPHTWSYMRDDEQDFRPQVFVRDPNDGAPYRKDQRHQFWVIEGKLQSKGSNVGTDVPSEVGWDWFLLVLRGKEIGAELKPHAVQDLERLTLGAEHVTDISVMKPYLAHRDILGHIGDCGEAQHGPLV